MLIIVFLAFIPAIISSAKDTKPNYAVVSTDIDLLTEQTTIDQKWMDYMINAPTSISLLGQLMVVSSKVDTSFERYSPNHVYKYIKYPKSFRATLLQVSNEGYRAFLSAHKSMNQIRLFMQQIPQHIKTMIKVLSSKASARLTKKLVTISMNSIERISKNCTALAVGSENAFKSVLDLLDEVIEITTVTQSSYDEDKRWKEVELNLTRNLQADLQRQNEERRRHYDDIRKTVRDAQEQYSKALRDIPTGAKALLLDLGRAVISAIKTFAMVKMTQGTGGYSSLMQGGKQRVSNNPAQSFGADQTLNYVINFANSLNNLIRNISSNEGKQDDKNELKNYKVIFGTFQNMIKRLPDNNVKQKASELIQRAVATITSGIENNNATIVDDLKAIANEVKPLVAAQQLSSANTQPIAVTPSGQGGADSSQNEILKARIAESRLGAAEQRLDAYHNTYMQAMEQMRMLTAKLAEVKIEVIHFQQILEMLIDAMKLLASLRKSWNDLVLFFTNFSAQVVTSFDEKVKTFIEQASTINNEEVTAIDRQLVLELLNGDDSNSLFHEAYFLFILSRTYFDVSTKYLMPRISGLALMLTAKDDNERQKFLQQLQSDVEEVQVEVKELVEKRQELYQKIIRKKRAELNEKIDEQGEDEGEDDIINEGKKLIGYDSYADE